MLQEILFAPFIVGEGLLKLGLDNLFSGKKAAPPALLVAHDEYLRVQSDEWSRLPPPSFDVQKELSLQQLKKRMEDAEKRHAQMPPYERVLANKDWMSGRVDAARYQVVYWACHYYQKLGTSRVPAFLAAKERMSRATGTQEKTSAAVATLKAARDILDAFSEVDNVKYRHSGRYWVATPREEEVRVDPIEHERTTHYLGEVHSVLRSLVQNVEDCMAREGPTAVPLSVLTCLADYAGPRASDHELYQRFVWNDVCTESAASNLRGNVDEIIRRWTQACSKRQCRDVRACVDEIVRLSRSE